MSSFHLRTSIALLLTFLVTFIHCTPLRHSSRPQPSLRRRNVPNHPISGISDFHPSSIAPYSDGDTNEDVAICLAIKDEYHDLTEWLVHDYDHHGIRRFYLMDDGRSPRMESFGFGEVVDERVITHWWMEPGKRREGQQHKIYKQYVAEFGNRHKWMGFIDTDEFLEVKAPYTLHGVLSALEGNETGRPAGQGVRQSFTQCITDEAEVEHGGNRFIKSSVKTHAWRGVWKVHKAELVQGMETVGENWDIVTEDMVRVPSTKDKIVMHHYATRSKTEYAVKFARGAIMFEEIIRGARYWREMEEAPSYECLEMAAYNP